MAEILRSQDQGETARELTRRARIEHEQRFKDSEEDYGQARQVASSDEERTRLAAHFSAIRKEHRLTEIAAGRRQAGMAVVGKQNFWLTWTQIAVAHEMAAREQAAANPTSGDPLGAEFAASLVTITAAAFAMEALYSELKYLVPTQAFGNNGRKLEQYKVVRRTFAAAFGLSSNQIQQVSGPLKQMFTRRNSAAHPFSEFRPLAPHPTGVNSTAELADFNERTCGEAVDCVLDVLAIAAAPASPYNRWVERWVHDNASTHTDLIDPLRSQRTT